MSLLSFYYDSLQSDYETTKIKGIEERMERIEDMVYDDFLRHATPDMYNIYRE